MRTDFYQKKDPPLEAMGRSRGDRNSKTHVVGDALGLPLELKITEGQAHDMRASELLLQAGFSRYVIYDKGYDSKALRLQAQAL